MKLLLLHDFLAGTGRENLVGVEILLSLTLDLPRNLLVVGRLPYFVQVVMSTFSWGGPSLLWASANLWMEQLLACLWIVKIVS